MSRLFIFDLVLLVADVVVLAFAIFLLRRAGRSGPPRQMVDNQTFIVRVVVPTLALVVLAVVFALLYGLFDLRVDNDKIFAIIGPAFQTIVGVFAGFIGGYAVGKASSAAASASEAP